MLRLCALLLAPLGAAGAWQWTVQHGGSDSDYFRALQVHPNGNITAAGYTYSSLDGYTNAGSSDAFLMSFDSTGAWQWTVQRGGSGTDYANALQVHPNGSLIAAGFTYSSLDGNTNAGSGDALLMSFDSTGAWQWTVQRGGSDGDYPTALQARAGDGACNGSPLQVHPNGSLIVAGSTYSSLDGYTNAGGFDAFLMSFDSTGAWQWTVQRGSSWDVFRALEAGSGGSGCAARAGDGACNGSPLQVHPNGNLIAAGETSSSLDGYTNAGGLDAFLMSFDSTGAWQWTVQRGSSDDYAYALQARAGDGACNGSPLQVHPNGSLIVAGYTYSSLDGYTNAGSRDALLMSFDSTGAWQWTVQRGSGIDDFRALEVHPNGNLIAAGSGGDDAFLMSFEAATTNTTDTKTVSTSITDTRTWTTQTTTTTTSSTSSSQTVSTSITATRTWTTQTTTTTTSSTSSSEGRLSCEDDEAICAEISFEGGARIVKNLCFSAPCPVLCESATAQKCSGSQGEEFCLPITGGCPVVCKPDEVECYLENFDALGQREEDSLQCVLQTELPCPCGRNQISCEDPGLGANCAAAAEGCPTFCDPASHRLCLSASFTVEGALAGLEPQCTERSTPCPCGENARACDWMDSDGLQCFATATDCPLNCSKVCNIADYNSSTGELVGVRQTCANESEACPCGDFAFRCQDFCVPGNFPCPVTCASEEKLCLRPSFDEQGEHLTTEEVCVPRGDSCGCGQGAFNCVREDGSSECLPAVGGHCCPVSNCAGGVHCPLVTNFRPDGAEISQSLPSRECANSTRECSCGHEAKWCDSLGCIFKDADCPLLCTEQQKLCSLLDYTSDGIFVSYRDICLDADLPCPCGLNTWRCPGSDLCMLPDAGVFHGGALHRSRAEMPLRQECCPARIPWIRAAPSALLKSAASLPMSAQSHALVSSYEPAMKPAHRSFWRIPRSSNERAAVLPETVGLA
ncbi:flaEY [Symbiodinium sp. CCMP2592]|nr:flaEY [Symbiodinium sp. CCMP2592]